MTTSAVLNLWVVNPLEIEWLFHGAHLIVKYENIRYGKLSFWKQI